MDILFANILVDYLYNECKKDDSFLRSACKKLVDCFIADMGANPCLLVDLLGVRDADTEKNK